MWFDIAENYSCKLLGYDAVQFGRRPCQSDIDVRFAGAGRRTALNERRCLLHQRKDKVTDHKVDRSLPTTNAWRYTPIPIRLHCLMRSQSMALTIAVKLSR